MKNIYVIFLALALAACSKPPAERPNILLIMVDDLGYSDLGCYGGEIQTPNINALASDGLLFTQFYNCARCCPTRAALMTGKYPHQVGVARNGRSLTPDGLTIAEVLKPAGYQTGWVGKWHLSQCDVLDDAALHQKWLDHQYDPGTSFGPLESYPVNRGFDKAWGIIWGVINYFDPFSLVDGEQPVNDVPNDFYMTNAITQKSVDFIQEFAKSDDPFFLYVAHAAPHWPLHALPKDIEKYAGTYDDGWEQLRQNRWTRQQDLGIVDDTFECPPVQDGGYAWDSLSEDDKKYQAQKMTAHAAMVDRVDQGIGQIIETLKQTGVYDNTIIMILADNGASPEIVHQPGYDRTAETRDGQKVIYENAHGRPEKVGPETSYTCIGQPWASACNTPFRFWKKESFEGGAHTPFIVHWPKGLKATGEQTNQIGHVMDVMPTCMALAGATYPKELNGESIAAIEGESLLPILNGKERQAHEALYFEHEGGRAIRQGEWKLVALAFQPWELYNMADDPTEMHNLADQMPEKVQEMNALWQAWAERVNVPPPPDWLR